MRQSIEDDDATVEKRASEACPAYTSDVSISQDWLFS